MDYTKEIRSGDKKRVKTGVKTHAIAPPRLGAGRLCGLPAAAGLLADGLAGGGGWLEAYAAGWRMLAFLGAGDARRKRDAAVGGGAVGGCQVSGGDGLPGVAGRWRSGGGMRRQFGGI